MKRYILTGASGAGKTSIILALETMGYIVVHEAATDVIAAKQAQGIKKPWRDISFIDNVLELQKKRQGDTYSALQFFDRSPIDMLIFCEYMGYTPSPKLLAEIERIKEKNIYQKKLFFIENIGFCKETPIRQISFEEALKFEKIHEDIYSNYGYELIRIAPQEISQRVNNILSHI